MTIKDRIRDFLESQPENVPKIFHARILWRILFRCQVARGSVTRALGELSKEGLVKKSDMKGRNSMWIINKRSNR